MRDDWRRASASAASMPSRRPDQRGRASSQEGAGAEAGTAPPCKSVSPVAGARANPSLIAAAASSGWASLCFASASSMRK